MHRSTPMLKTLKDIINNFIDNNSSVLRLLNKTQEDFQNGKEVIPGFVDVLIHNQYNPALGIDFADVLQLSDNKSIYEQYELEDIGRLYNSLIELQDSNLETYVEAANFEFAVLNNADKAKEIAMAGIEKAMKKVEELRKLLNMIEEELHGA